MCKLMVNGSAAPMKQLASCVPNGASLQGGERMGFQSSNWPLVCRQSALNTVLHNPASHVPSSYRSKSVCSKHSVRHPLAKALLFADEHVPDEGACREIPHRELGPDTVGGS